MEAKIHEGNYIVTLSTKSQYTDFKPAVTIYDAESRTHYAVDLSTLIQMITARIVVCPSTREMT